MRRWLVCLLVAAGSVAQQPASRPPGSVPDRRDALRWVRLLELPERRSEAWLRLAQLGETAVPPLCDALDDPRPDVATRAAWVLGWLGPQASSALARLDETARKAAPAVADACRWARARIELRVTVLTDYEAKEAVVLSPDGKELRRQGGMRGLWHAELLPRGHLLVSEYTGNAVRELDEKGNEVWSFAGVNNPYGASRLPGGNTLIADAGGHRVVEVDGKGEVAWQCADLGRPVDVDRLLDGNTLVTDQEGGRVLELDPSGKVVWKLEGLDRPMSAERLPGGNTLIAIWKGGEVREVDRAGKAVLTLEVPQAQNAHRLPDGHTLVAATSCWIEYDALGKEIWRRKAAYATDIVRW